ncbi:CopY/TcrY family copper transport repressor [Periweissella cryptocerci]|uniref:CopY/TcrY family copper transport repressor n=1 Tax=Periweissella cryptocerci TaxID=2506420 RepID=A0A4P6YRP0_9LACO|nr:BlaI/MecI/CopY family transcriptional regulator [Periweissella cryptocerci]QBO35328.1 CopY/TcrY family copper transport repressor [Periweissella cryptocerci]
MTKNIAESEWAVMRVLWTLGAANSNELVQIMAEKKHWSSSTTKTIITRLHNKALIVDDGEVRNRQYRPVIQEADTMTSQLTALMHDMCAMKVGTSLNEALDDVELSQDDISQLITKLNAKLVTAPQEVICDCLPAGCNEKHQHNKTTGHVATNNSNKEQANEKA